VCETEQGGVGLIHCDVLASDYSYVLEVEPVTLIKPAIGLPH